MQKLSVNLENCYGIKVIIENIDDLNERKIRIEKYYPEDAKKFEELILKSSNTNCDRMITNAISFIDDELLDTYNYLKKHYTKKELEEDHLGTSIIHYLYARSFYKDIAIPAKMNEAFNYFKKQCENYWTYKSFYEKGMIALSLHRFDNSKISENIVASLKENAMRNEEMGMYWKYSTGYFWYEAPIETQALLIETFSEIDPVANLSDVEEMKIWLIKQKQTQDWRTTKATVEAVSALMLQGNNLLATKNMDYIYFLEINTLNLVKKITYLSRNNVLVLLNKNY